MYSSSRTGFSEGRFGVLCGDETEEVMPFYDQGVEIAGYDAQKTDDKPDLHYKDTLLSRCLGFSKAAVNDEHLKQEITAA